jgi:hypothetical protein
VAFLYPLLFPLPENGLNTKEIGDGFKFLVIAFVSLRIPLNLLQYTPGPTDRRIVMGGG